MAPGLTGGEFTSNWNDLSLGDLFERMRISMPQNAPGSLSRQQNADILAFVLQARATHRPARPNSDADRDAERHQVRSPAARTVTQRLGLSPPSGLRRLQMLREAVQEQADIGDDADGLRRAAIGQLRHDRRIDVDAHHPHPRRQHVPDADAVQHRRQRR